MFDDGSDDSSFLDTIFQNVGFTQVSGPSGSSTVLSLGGNAQPATQQQIAAATVNPTIASSNLLVIGAIILLVFVAFK